jgi:FtsZ-interacting cell division protein ZipA
MKVNIKYLSIGLLILALFSIVILTYMYWTKRWSLGNVWGFKNKNDAESENSETEIESGVSQSEDEEEASRTRKPEKRNSGKKVSFQEDAYPNEYDSEDFTSFGNIEESVMPVEPEAEVEAEETKLDLDSIPMFTRVERMFT